MAAPTAMRHANRGGLLVRCASESADAVVAVFNSDGFSHAAIIGSMQTKDAQVTAR